SPSDGGLLFERGLVARVDELIGAERRVVQEEVQNVPHPFARRLLAVPEYRLRPLDGWRRERTVEAPSRPHDYELCHTLGRRNCQGHRGSPAVAETEDVRFLDAKPVQRLDEPCLASRQAVECHYTKVLRDDLSVSAEFGPLGDA